MDTTYVVKGTVRYSDGSAAEGVSVTAFDKDLRHEQPLGDGAEETDALGAYRIPYTEAQFRRSDETSADIIVRAKVTDATGKTVEVASPVHFNVPPEVIIDLVIPAFDDGLSEFERHAARMAPALEGQGVIWAELTEHDIDFLAGDIGIPRQHIAWLAAAARAVAALNAHSAVRLNAATYAAAREREEDAITPAAIPVAAFYAWFRDGKPTKTSELFKRSKQQLIDSLKRSVADRIVPPQLADSLEEIGAALDARRRELALLPATNGAPASLGDLLNTVKPNWLGDNKRAKIVDLLDRIKHTSGNFPEEASKLGLSKAEVTTLHRTLRLGDLTDGNTALVAALQPRVDDDKDASLAGLAEVTQDEWVDLAYTHGVPAGKLISPERYGNELAVAVESQNPTAVLRGKIGDGTFSVDRPGFAAIGKVLTNNPTFDIAKDNVDVLIRDGKFTGVGTDRKLVGAALKNLQRLKSLGASWDEAGALHESGIGSMEDLAGLGRDQAVLLLGSRLPSDRIAEIHGAARDAQAVGIGISALFQPARMGLTTNVMEPGKPSKEDLNALEDFPTLRSLFGGLDTCACEQCLSVLSPAAYFVDLLRFVETYAKPLVARRPDLFDLELSCDNTQIELPHIDLVLEILENAVALPLDVAGEELTKELKSSPLGQHIKDALQQTALEPLGDLSAFADTWSMRPFASRPGIAYWVVKDQYRRWLLKVSDGYLGPDEILGPKAGISLDDINTAQLLKAFNGQAVPRSVRERLDQYLVGREPSKLPLSVTDVSIERVVSGSRWKVTYSLGGRISIDDASNTVKASALRGNGAKAATYSTELLAATRRNLDEKRVGSLFRTADPAPRDFVVEKRDGGWIYGTPIRTGVISYQPAGISIVGLTYQSTASDRDLTIRPQNCDPYAYKILKGATFPWTLPFDFQLSEVRALLEKSGSPRIALMETAAPDDGRYNSTALAYERLGLSMEQAEQITTPRAGDDLWAAWGLKESAGKRWVVDTYCEGEDEQPDSEASSNPQHYLTRTGTGLKILSCVSVILQQARISLGEFQEIIETDFVAGGRHVEIKPTTECDPCKLTAVGLTEGHLDRLHRFCRLWRVLEWAPWELDLAIASVGGSVDRPKDLVNLANIALLHERIQVPVEVIATWFGQFGKTTYRRYALSNQPEVTSLYNRIFQDRNVLDPPDAELKFEKLVDPGPPSLGDKATQIATALRIRTTDLADFLGSEADGLSAIGQNGALSATNLHKAWRNVSFAKVVDLSVTEYAAMWHLLDETKPRLFDAPASLLSYLDGLEFIRRADVPIPALEYVLRDAADADIAGAWPMSPERVLALLQELQVALRAAAQAQPSPPTQAPEFGLTEDLLKTTPFSGVPPDAAHRWQRWGIQDDDPANPGATWSVANPYKPDDVVNRYKGPDPLQLLGRSGVLAQQARLGDNELWDVLQTIFVDPNEPPGLTVDPVSADDPRIAVRNLSEAHLDRIDRFVAIKRVTGLRAYELDLMLQAFCFKGAREPLDYDLTILTGNSSKKIAGVGTNLSAFAARLSLPLDEVISWWGGLSTRRYLAHTQPGQPPIPQVFDRLFPGPGARFRLSADRTELESVGAVVERWNDVQHALAGALSVPEPEVELLLTQPAVGKQVKLENLSAMHRLASLSKALKLSVEALARMQRSMSIDPFDDARTALDFADKAPRRYRLAETVARTLGDRLNLPADISGDVLWDYLKCPSAAARDAIELFLDDGFFGDRQLVPSGLETSDEYSVVIRLYKFGLLNAGWKLSHRDLRWLPRPAGGPAGFSGIELNTLPVGLAPAVSLRSWSGSSALVTLARSAKGMPQLLDDYWGALSLGNAQCRKALCDAFAVDDSTVAKATGRIGMAAEADYADPILVVRLITLLSSMQRLGITADDLGNLVDDPIGADGPSVARKVMRARFGEKDWDEPLRQATNRLRIAQRDRLADYLVWRDDLRDSSELYDRYLIDVEMAPCMLTTRLLQSIAAVQLFVYRCLMNLEPSVSPDLIDRGRWDWTKNYRVWEANRKVFLYPENWLIPELRDDKTETFRNFESALTQNEVSHANSVQAVKSYLDGLLDISQITVLGMYAHEPADSKHTLYVVGRSPNPPYTFYWRCATDYGESGSRWSGWERIDLDLSGDHILAFVFEGDLHVAWPVIKRTKDANDKDWFDLQLAWTRKTSTGWTKRKISREASFEAVKSRDERSMFAFRVIKGEAGALSIRCFSARDPTPVPPPPEPTNSLTPTGVSDGPGGGKKSVRIDAGVWAKYDDESYTAVPSLTILVQQAKQDGQYETLPIEGGLGANFPGLVYPGISFSIADDVQKLYLTFMAWNGQGWQRVAVADLKGDGRLSANGRSVEDGDSVTLSFWFVIDAGKNPIGAETGLPLFAVGEHVFEPGKDVEWNGFGSTGSTVIPTGQICPDPDRITPPDGTYVWSSGFREAKREAKGDAAVNGAPDGAQVGLDPVFAESKAGQFFAIAAAPYSSDYRGTTWYINEGANQLIARLGPNQLVPGVPASSDPIVLPCSFSDDVANYKTCAATSPASLLSLTNQGQDGVTISGVGKGRNLWFRTGNDGTDSYFAAEANRDVLSSPMLAFELSMPCAGYNWEVFHHLPIAAATAHRRHQRFEDAERWFNFVFDPTTNDATAGRERFWRFLPFRNANRPTTVTELVETLVRPDVQDKGNVRYQVTAWVNDPFSPFAVARLRNSAFQWSVVTDYIRNEIEWGDQLFRRDTRESINEATLHYILAAKILGRRPSTSPRRESSGQAMSYRELMGRFGDDADIKFHNEFPDTWIALQDSPTVRGLLYLSPTAGDRKPTDGYIASIASTGWLYFCVPPNDKLVELWDLVEDRLFKIRNCQNIDGQTRSLPLFDPPIDPELLIRAKAAGLDLSDVLSDRFAPLPQYRFAALLQKAHEFCNEVKALGAATLATIEKKDAEHLALLRSSQELELLKLAEGIKDMQVKEADANITALRQTRANSVERFKYLQHLLGNTTISVGADGVPVMEQSPMFQAQESGAPEDFRGLALIQPEIDQIVRLQEQHVASIVAGALKVVSGVTSFTAGALAMYTPTRDAGNGLFFVSRGLSDTAEVPSLIATNASMWERRAALMGSYQRRRDDWVHQAKAVVDEVRQIDKQIIGLTIRKSITQKELPNHQRQIELTSNVDDFIRYDKFSTESLYTWMLAQTSSAYFSSYHMAFDLAKRAERAFCFELGDESANFIQFGYWDNLKKGLLSGERLGQDLRRLESAYLERSRRELEITKHVSLRQLDPLALMKLRATGVCEFEVPEVVYDLDFPGHFFRRIKSASVTIPCVVGPYTSVSGTLTLLSSKLRAKDPPIGNNYTDEANFRASYLPLQAIATSSAQNDSGLFELNFRDERLLPFEGAGAISRWRFRLPETFRAFDYDTIGDLILHVRYTARDAGEVAATRATKAALERINALKEAAASAGGMTQMLSLRHDYPNEWNKLRSAKADFITAKLPVDRLTFPFILRDTTLKILSVTALVRLSAAAPAPTLALSIMGLPTPTATDTLVNLLPCSWSENVLQGTLQLVNGGKELDTSITWDVAMTNLESVAEVILLVNYLVK
jgi:hypothetical protein